MKPENDFKKNYGLYIPLSDKHREWLENISQRNLSGNEKSLIVSVLVRGAYNWPAQEILNRIRFVILNLKK